MTHTPDKWILDEDGEPFIYQLNEAGINLFSLNVQGGLVDTGERTSKEHRRGIAEFIHRACNAHDELVAALTETMRVLRYLRDRKPDQYDALVNGSSDYCNMWDRNKQAIANAEKGAQV